MSDDRALRAKAESLAEVSVADFAETIVVMIKTYVELFAEADRAGVTVQLLLDINSAVLAPAEQGGDDEQSLH